MVTSNLNDVATPSGVLTDEQFYGIQNAGGLSAVPVEDRGFFGAHLNQFMAFRESAPNEQWKQYKASEDAKRAEGMARLGSLSLDFDKATADVDLPSLKLAPDPATKQAGKDALLADTFIQHKTGQGFTGAMRERMRDAVATEFFGEGVGVGSDAEFAKAANAWAVKNRDFQKLVAGDGTGDSDSMSLQRWAAKTALVGVPAADAFAEWQKAVKDAPEYAAAKGKDLLGMWNDVYGKTAELVGDNAPRLRAAFEKMQASMGSKPGSAAGGDGTDVFDVSAELEGMSLEDFRKVGVPAIRAMAEFASKGDKGVMAQMLESFTRPIGNNVSAMGDVMQWLSAAMPSEMVLPESQLAGEQAGRDMRSQLRQLMDNTVDPITNLAKSGVGVNLENMLYDTAGSLGMMSQLAVPYVGAALQMAGYQDATVGRLLMEHPTMKPEDARLIGAIEAPFEYLGDKLEFAALKGRLPGASKLLSAMAGPGGSVGKFLGYVGLNAGIEYAAEKYQDAVPIVTQNLIAALKEDVPAGSWDDFKMLDLRTFLAVLPLSLIGAGVHTVVERGAVKELVQDKELLRVVGFSDEQISRITTGDDVGKRVEMVQALWSERGAVVTVARNESEAAADAVLQDPTAEVSQKVAAADYKATLGAVDALGNANADWKAAQAAMDDAGLSMQVERGADGKPLWTVRDRETGNETEHPTFNSAWAHVHGKMGEMDVEDALNMATVAEFFIKQKSGMGESVEFTGQVKSALDALAGDNATAEAMAERIRIEEQRQGLQPGELIAPLVLGSNRVAFAEMVGDATKRVVAASMSKVNAGGNVLTVIEEVIEGREKAVLDRDMKLRWVRMAEAATGEQFLKKGAADADVTARDLTEAVSHIVQAEVLNRRKNGGKFARVGGAVSAGLAKVGGDAKSSGQFKTFLGAMKALLGAIFRTAAKLSKAQREGKLGEDYHAFVDQLLGLDEQARHNAAVAGQVEGGLPQKGAEGAKDGGETFSLGRVEHLTAKTIDGRILHDKSARNSPSSILSALGLGKEGGAADPEQRRKHGRQLARASELARWAEGEGRSYHEKTALGAAERILGGGGEHVVFLDETGNRVLKRTKAGLFGAQGNDVGEYLQRWALHNEVFGDDVRIEGVTKLAGDDEIRVIVSQPFFEGRDATSEELSEYLASKGFVPWENWGAWVHPVRGVAVWDTQTPGNALMTAEGVRAIDLQIAPAANDVLKQVRDETGFGKDTSFSLASPSWEAHLASHGQESSSPETQETSAVSTPERKAGIHRGRTAWEGRGLSDLRKRFLDSVAEADDARKEIGDRMHTAAGFIMDEIPADAEYRQHVQAHLTRIENAIREGAVTSTMFGKLPIVSYRDGGKDYHIPAEVQQAAQKELAHIKEALDFKAPDPMKTWEELKAMQAGGHGGEHSAVTYSIAPTAHMELLARSAASHVADPSARLEIWAKVHDQLQGMARAIAHNDKVDGMVSAHEIERERIKRKREALAVAFAEIDKAFPNLTESEYLSTIANNPLLSEFFRFEKGKPPRGRLRSRATAERHGDVKGDYDGSDAVPWYFFLGSEKPDSVLTGLQQEGLMGPDTNVSDMFERITKELASVAKHKDRLSKYAQDRFEARQRITEETNAWAEQERAALPTRAPERAAKDQRRFMAALDYILMQFPSEVRDKVGGFAQLANLETNAQRTSFILRRIERLDHVLENFLTDEFTAGMQELVEQAKAKREPGKKPRGKLGAAGHRYFDLVEHVMGLNTTEVAAFRAGIVDEMGRDETTPERALELWEQEQVLDTYGNWSNKSASEMGKALEQGWDVYRDRRNKRLAIEQARIAEVKALTAATVEALGGVNVAASQAQKANAKKALKILGVGALDLKSFSELMTALLGRGNPLAKRWADAARRGMAQKTDEVLATNRRWKDALYKATGKRGVAARRRLWEMSQEQSLTISKALQTTTKVDEVPVVLIDQWAAGKADPAALGLSPFEARQLMDDRAAMSGKDRRQSIPVERSKRVGEESVKLTEAEGVFLLMLSAQEQYRASLDKAGWDHQAISQIEENLSPAALKLRDFMAREYQENYAPLAALMDHMFGVNLPQLKNYSPGAFYNLGADKAMDPTNTGTVEGGMRDGFLMSRKSHAAAPKLENAFAKFFGHAHQTAHWKAMAELTRELRGVFGNPEVKQSMNARHGEAMGQAVNQWMRALEGNGLAKEAGLMDKAVGWLTTSQAYIALAFKLGTIVKQSTALLGAAYKIPTSAYLRGLGKLLTGQLDVSMIYNTDFIQRRMNSGYSPEVRAAMQQVWNAPPTRRRALLEAGMEFIGLTDAFFTTGSAAIAYDHFFRESKNEGMPDATAQLLAMEQAERVVSETAQPAEVTDRSLFELQQGAFGRLLFMFASEARQKSSLLATAWGNTLTGKATAADVRVLALSHLIVGPLVQAMTAMIRDLKDDDDDEILDAEHWNVSDFLKAAVAGPLSGVPLLGEMLSGFSNDGILGRFKHAGSSLKDLLVDGIPKHEDEPVEWYVNRIAKVLQGTSAELGVLGSVVDQVFDLVDNAHTDDVEQAGMDKRKATKEKKESKAAGK